MAKAARVQNRLAEIRKSRGVGAADLAKRVGVSRQTVYAIEAGTYIPNTQVALHLARELQVAVEELFSLTGEPSDGGERLASDLLSASTPLPGQPVRICQVGSRRVSIPVSASPYYLPEADGVIERAGRANSRADLSVFANDEPGPHKRLVLAGCDPATGLLARMVENISGVEVVSAAASSKLALQWLREGKVHIAGSHLEDARTGEFNLPFIRKQFPDGDFRVVTFARWEEGLVLAPANPKEIRDVEDLARKTVRFVNREAGSGSRALLDKRLAAAGIETHQIHGYDRVAYGHLAAAYCVVSGEADVCLATRSAARTFGLGFIPLHSERYDLVMRKDSAALPAVQSFLDVLQRAALRRKLEVLAGYDTTETGVLVA
uniref:Transcriptional regulator of molybdate metabolism, XRE family n=1 Tax=Solibacter usitatus (strain Ellin6076) TaxID=234267 RepID=Q023L3_SOLUE